MSEYNQSECIYNILEKKKKKVSTGMYRSKFPHNIAPTGSTFINKNTTRPGVANLGGDYQQFKGGHEFKFATQTFGKPKGELRPQTAEFCRKGAHIQTQDQAFKIKQEHTYKPPLPKFNKEQMNNLQSSTQDFNKSKNFVVLNAIDAANMQIPIKKSSVVKEKQQQQQFKNYGIVPKYLETVKKDIEKEYRVYQRNMRILRGQPPDEINPNQPTKESLIKKREQLKDRWSYVNEKYSKMAHKTKFDTLIEKEKKASYEKELNSLELEIRKLRLDIQNAK